MKHHPKTERETQKIAQNFAQNRKKGDIILLQGNLGMGKTVFARSLIRELMNDQNLEVPSPTFTLLQTYEAEIAPIYHFDLYRLEDPEEIFELGWEDAISSGITIVEWPERLGPYKPAQTLDITISKVENDQNAREILIQE